MRFIIYGYSISNVCICTLSVPFLAEERDQLKELPKKECIFQSAVIFHTLHEFLASSLGVNFPSHS